MSIDIEVVNVVIWRINRITTHKVTYMGRGSDFGNPWPMKDESERDEVCDLYHDYFYMLSQGSERFQKLLSGLADLHESQGYLRLGCYCKPKRCHVDIIAEYLTHLLKERQHGTLCDHRGT